MSLLGEKRLTRRTILGAAGGTALLALIGCGATTVTPTAAPAQPTSPPGPAGSASGGGASPATSAAPASSASPARAATAAGGAVATATRTAAPATATRTATVGAAVATAAAPNRALSGPLVIYTGRAEALFKPVVDAFNRAYPNVQVALLAGANGALATKILEERNNPQGDLYVSTDMLTVINAASQGAFAPLDAAVLNPVPASYRADDGTWVSLTLRPRVIIYNTTSVTAAEAPKSLFDLTDPRWRGQIGSADSTNGSVIANIAALRRLVGEARAESFVRGLVGNGTKFFGGHTDVRKAVGAGELRLGFVNHYYYHLSRAEGAPLGIVYPDQGSDQIGLVVNTTAAGIVKGAKNQERAAAFLQFMLGAEGQQVYAEKNYEYPILPGVALAPGVEPLEKYRQANISLKALAEELPAARALAQRAGLP
jgi:iron(III) transport system substrate-binding protein